ncbi:MAG: hypothetical protein RLZZ262_776 [Bacteroidota bacterium]|jgi:uracil-DNA glycosylase
MTDTTLDIRNQMIEFGWGDFIAQAEKLTGWSALLKNIQIEYSKGVCYPAVNHIFRAFELTPLEKIKIVILGQDPYHQPNQAHGLAFSVQSQVAAPPSLRNIFKELKRNPTTPVPWSNDLSGWAKQGVFLLNTWLTVRKDQPGSHRSLGWEEFTDLCIEYISTHCEHVVFMLWGAPAQTKQKLIDVTKHSVLVAPHPSPLSAHRGFLGCDHFLKANALLQSNGQIPIDWSGGQM